MDDFLGEDGENNETVPGNRERTMPDGFDPSLIFGENGEMPENFDPSEFFGGGNVPDMSQDGQTEGNSPGRGGAMGNMGGGMGQSDVLLQYIDDNFDSYPNIFGNTKTDTTDADQARLIKSLKKLSEGESIENVVDVESVIKYLVAHDFVQNGDSYTGSMVHNYYLYEKNGVLSMIPWDYNLAFGGFAMGGTSGATSVVNSPIDTPVSGGTLESRPMVAWIFESEEYTALYHQYYAEFIADYFDSGYFEQMMDETVALISPYIEKAPTAFCTYDEFLVGVETLRQFCMLRTESVSGQLSGTIPSTQESQSADSTALVDASHITISDMGSMGGGGGFGGNMPDMGEMPSVDEGEQQGYPNTDDEAPATPGQNDAQERPVGGRMPRGDFDVSQMPEGFDSNNMPEGGESLFGQNGGEGATFPNRMPTENVAQEDNSATLILMLSSTLILVLGIVFVFNYRRRK